MIDSDQFLYWEAFETNDGINYIGTKYSDYAGGNKVVIVEDMAKLHTLVSYFPEFKSIYLKVDKHEIHTINEDAICEEGCKTHGTTLL